MTAVYQTKYTRDEGNCLTACVASVLNLPISALPEFCVDGEWFERLDTFCRENGFFLMYWRHSENVPLLCLNAYVIVLLELEGEETLHAVVGRTLFESKAKLTDAEIERTAALGELAGCTSGADRWGWKTEPIHDPNQRSYPPVKGPVGYIMIGKQ